MCSAVIFFNSGRIVLTFLSINHAVLMISHDAISSEIELFLQFIARFFVNNPDSTEGFGYVAEI